jgi:hypothetical protein
MSVDMSAHAVTTRLRRVAQLRRLCLSLARARRSGQGAAERRVYDGPMVGATGGDDAVADRLTAVLARWRFGARTGEEVIGWAIEMLEAGHDTATLRILAGLSPGRQDNDEIDHYLRRARDELGYQEPHEGLLRRYVALVCRDVCDGRVPPSAAARELFDLWAGADYPKYLQSLASFDDGYALAEQGSCGTVHEVEADMLAEAHRFLRAGGYEEDGE